MSHATPIVLREAELRVLEATHARRPSKTSLMQRAGAAVATHAQDLLKRNKRTAIVVLAGPGDNGGDAWVAAEILRKVGQRVTVVAPGDGQSTAPAAKAAQAAFRRARGAVRRDLPAAAPDLVIDGLFGIGLGRAPQGVFEEAILRVNAWHREGVPTLAIDVPSGLAADTGAVPGAAIEATRTITFLAFKPGLFTAAGRDHAGEIELDSLGVTAAEATGELLLDDTVRALIPERRQAVHKGDLGSVGIVGGSPGMAGAAVLAARAALYMGPGKVYLGLALRDAPAFDPLNPELMIRQAADVVADPAVTALAVGMGLGTDRAAERLVAAAVARDLPMVLDADALNLLAAKPALLPGTRKPKSSTSAASRAKMAGNPRQSSDFILTPHPGEAGRLLGITTATVQADRIDAARELSRRWNAVAVLKGSGTVVAAPDGRYFINTSGNPGMASGGMGDALSGMIAAFLAQGMPALDAARLAVYLHGAAADACMAHGMAPRGLTASEVIFEARNLLNAGLEHHDH